MEEHKKIEDAIAGERLKRRVLERWENEGGSICTDSGNTSRSFTLRDRQSSGNDFHSCN